MAIRTIRPVRIRRRETQIALLSTLGEQLYLAQLVEQPHDD